MTNLLEFAEVGLRKIFMKEFLQSPDFWFCEPQPTQVLFGDILELRNITYLQLCFESTVILL